MPIHPADCVSGDPRVEPAAGVGLDRPDEVADQLDALMTMQLLAEPPVRGPVEGGPPERHLIKLSGPAFVAAIAYVDPGNVAANLTAGAEYGYLLVWVLVLASAAAVVVQYLSAKLGIVTSRSLPQVLGERLPRWSRLVYWAQAELTVAATEVAEIIGGALALHILFGLPLVTGGVVVFAVSIGILAVQSRRRQQTFELVVIGMLLVITAGFLAGLVVSPLDVGQALAGVGPRFEDSRSVLLAASMIGATVMPHAIYAHSSLARDRHRTTKGVTDPWHARRLLRATRLDVGAALALAGGVNIAMLLLAAASLHGEAGTDSIPGAIHAITAHLGSAVGIAFGVGLLASGLASTAVGAYAGSEIMAGLLDYRVPMVVRRVVTLIPALVVLALGIDPTHALVLSQVVLSLGIPFALVPLAWFTGRPSVMGEFVNGRALRLASAGVTVGIIGLNIVLLMMATKG